MTIPSNTKHEHQYEFQPYCGVDICWDCDDHKGLDRCFCGWSRFNHNGYQELIEMGEVVDD